MIPLSVPYLNFILVSDIPNRIFDLHYICFPFTMRCNVGKKRKHGIIVFGWDRIDFMVMASGTSNSHTEKYFGGGAYYIVQVIIAGEHPVGGFIIPNSQPVKSGRSDCCGTWVFNFVPGKLFQNKLVIGGVLIKRIDYIVPVSPCLRLIPVSFISIGFSITNKIKPMPAPFLSIMGGGE